MQNPDPAHTLMQTPKGVVVINSLRHIATLTSEVLEYGKKNSKTVPKNLRDKLIEINHSAVMALNHVHELIKD